MDILIGMPPEFIYRAPASSAADKDIEPLLIQSDFFAQSQLPVILVVDDEPDVGTIVRRLLRSLFPQVEIITIADPADALQQIQGRAVVLVVADFNMPNMNGLQLIEKVKVYSPETKVLLITAYTTAILESLARQCGVDYYMAKPFNLTYLEQLVCEAVTAYQAKRAAAGDEAEPDRRPYGTRGDMVVIR